MEHATYMYVLYSYASVTIEHMLERTIALALARRPGGATAAGTSIRAPAPQWPGWGNKRRPWASQLRPGEAKVRDLFCVTNYGFIVKKHVQDDSMISFFFLNLYGLGLGPLGPVPSAQCHK